MGLTGESKGALQPKTSGGAMQGKGMHGAGAGASPAGGSNGTGIQRKVAEGYLKAAYGKRPGGEGFSVSGVAYKALEKDAVTTFYDAGGNTLFSLENRILEGMRRGLAGASAHKDAQHGAEEKLEKERKAAKDKAFAGSVISHLIKRCREDAGLAQDVMQGHKTWGKCLRHIRAKAMGQAVGGHAYVPDEVVYEWAEDYYRRDDKAEEEGKARKAAEREERLRKAAVARPEEATAGQGAGEKAPAPTAPEGGAGPERKAGAKKNGKDVEGQLDLFSMIGM